MKIGIDITFIKPKKTGGVESYLLNLLEGLLKEKKNKYILYLAKDNEEYIKDKVKGKNVEYRLCNVKADDAKGHLLFVLFKFHKIILKDKVDLMFFPCYMMPFFKTKKYKTVAVVHDIQAIHFPEYFPLFEKMWFNIAWRKLMFTADRIVSITNYTKNDLEEHFKHKDNIVTIYNPIILKDDEVTDFKEIEKKWDIKKSKYYYTVLSMIKHKNLITLINMIKKMKEDKIDDIPTKLVVSGVNGPSKDELLNIIKEYNLEDRIIITGFVSNKDRNSLIINSNVFLFPSIFEGFGMPPIEAMHFGAKVLTTKCASLPEVTQNKCFYVENPYDENEWIEKIRIIQKEKVGKVTFEIFDIDKISKEYLSLFEKVIKEK